MAEQRRPGVVIPPGGIGEVLDTGFTLARRNYRRLLMVGAWGLVPSYVLYFAANALASSATGEDPTASLYSFLLQFLLGGIVFWLGVVVSEGAVAIACIRLIEPSGEADELGSGGLYRAAWNRLGVLVLWTILVGLAAIPLIVVFPLGIYLAVRWALSWLAIFAEPVGPIAAFARSWRLTRGAWWHTGVTLLVAGLIVGILGFVVGGVFGAVGGIITAATGGGDVLLVFVTLSNALSTILVTPFSMAIMVVLYYELRARGEGFDLEQRGRQVASGE